MGKLVVYGKCAHVEFHLNSSWDETHYCKAEEVGEILASYKEPMMYDGYNFDEDVIHVEYTISVVQAEGRYDFNKSELSGLDDEERDIRISEMTEQHAREKIRYDWEIFETGILLK